MTTLDQDPLPDNSQPTFMGDVWNRVIEPIVPTLVELDGGGHLLYGGMTHSIAAPSGSGKSYIALAAMLEALRGSDRPVLMLDYEACLEVTLTRLRQLGATQAEADRFAYWYRDVPIQGDHAESLAAWVDQHRPCLIVLDGVTMATSLHGVDADTSNAGYSAWAGAVRSACRVNGANTDPALLLIDHVSEKTGGGLNARGVTAKRDTITGLALVLRGGAISESRQVKMSLIIAKARHGGDSGTPAAIVVITPGPDKSLTVEFRAPDDDAGVVVDTRLHELCVALAAALKQAGSLSQRRLITAVEGDNKAAARAVAHLENQGFIGRDTTARKAGGHYPYRLVKPYPAGDIAA